MRKQLGWVLIAALCLAVLSIGTVTAQDDKLVLKLGEITKGEITDKIHEIAYSFSGKKGDIVTLEMMPDPAQPDLDPAVELLNSDGVVLAGNGEFNYPLVLVIAELPSDGNYYAVAGRAGWDDGDTGGPYLLRVSIAKLVGPGSTINAEVSSDSYAPAQIYVMRPTQDGSLDITMTQKPGENYAGLRVFKWNESDYPDTLFNLDGTSKLTKATMTVDVKANNFYVFKLATSAASFADPVDFPVTLELK